MRKPSTNKEVNQPTRQRRLKARQQAAQTKKQSNRQTNHHHQHHAVTQHQTQQQHQPKTRQSQQQQPRLPAGSSQPECGCCYQPLAHSRLIQCSAGHSFCPECVTAYLTEKASGSGAVTFPCLALDCRLEFTKSGVVRLVDPRVLARLEERKVPQDGDDTRFVRCPSCQWGAILELSAQTFECQNCGLESCRYCGRHWAEHVDSACPGLDRETQLRREYEERMTAARLRQCPQCCTSVSKISGCNHVQCQCGANFCFMCGQLITSRPGYAHFCYHRASLSSPCHYNCGSNCLQNSDVDLEADRAIGELRDQARKRLHEEGFGEDRLVGPPPGEAPKRARLDMNTDSSDD